MKRDPLLQIENVRLSFSGRGEKIDAVRGVSLSLLPGESLALVGESGCGKTALCRSILMLHSRHAEWESGRILLCGKPVTNMTEKELEQVRGRDAAMIFQDPMTSLDPALSIGRQIMEPILLHQKQSRKAAQEKAMQLMEQVEIDHPQERFYQYPHHFSGGMRQRAAIAIALAADPRLIIADEPTTALDADVQDKIMALLLRLCRGQDRGLLFVTHDLRLARKAAERTAVMKDGLIVESGRTEELFSSPQHPYTRKLVELAACKERCIAEKAGRGQEKSFFPVRQSVKEEEQILVSVEGLYKSFPLSRHRQQTVLRDIDLTVHRGELVGLAGASGCGKSTLARCIMGLYRPEKGRIVFAEGCRRQMVFQDSASAFNPRMTIGEIIAEPLVIKGMKDKQQLRERVLERMAETELPAALIDRHPYDVSGGQRQRAAIARALITDPDLLVADEPVSSLDISSQLQIIRLLERLQRERQMAVLLITHDIPMIEEIADRIIRLDERHAEV